MTGSAVSISVVIPARNEVELLPAALRSVTEQRYAGSLDCVVVDNGSTDGTAASIDGLALGGAVPIAVIPEPVPGVGRAKNAGAAAAGGDVVIFLDADSRMAVDLAATVAASFAAGYEVGSIRVVSDGGAWLDRGFFRLMELGKRWFGIRAQMLYCRRSLFLALGGFSPDLTLGEDVDFLRRAQRHLKARGRRGVGHVSTSEILTSPRRLASNHHLGMIVMFVRWALALVGVGRKRNY